jgi:hypothetical protein
VWRDVPESIPEYLGKPLLNQSGFQIYLPHILPVIDAAISYGHIIEVLAHANDGRPMRELIENEFSQRICPGGLAHRFLPRSGA